MAYKEDLEEAAAEYVGDVQMEGDLTAEEKADIIASMKEDFMAGASQLAHFILWEINAGKSLSDIAAQLLELEEDVTDD
jgi:hypothetical protein